MIDLHYVSSILTPSVATFSTTFPNFTMFWPSPATLFTTVQCLSTVVHPSRRSPQLFECFVRPSQRSSTTLKDSPILRPFITSSCTTFRPSVTTFSTGSFLNCSAVHVLFVTLLVSPTFTYFSCAVFALDRDDRKSINMTQQTKDAGVNCMTKARLKN